MMIHQKSNEKGIALVMAIIGMMMIGALVTAVFAPTMLEHRLADNGRRAGQAFETTEFGLSEAIAGWDTGTWNSIDVADSAMFSGALASGNGSYEGVVHRLNNDLFLVDVTGRDKAGRTRQRVGHFVKLSLLDMDIEAALTTRGPTRIGGSAELDGNDTPPSGWGACGSLDSTNAGLRLPTADDLETNGGCSGGSCIDGNPPVDADSTMSDSTFFQFGDMDWAGLTGMAGTVLPPGNYKINPVITAGSCDLSDATNWGDPITPSSPCFDHFPIVYATGDMTINGDFGQGILLVEGDLSVQGGFQFYGITIVKGRLKTTGTGGHFNGAVMAANVDLDDITVLGDALVQFSSCAVERALIAASPGTPLRSRGWLYTQ